ncbi:hypothetical protein TcYC6_0117820 [Trypanosoma cruzi]|nr:hypothetical protein TcYC6_0117820 [Trypanosoma cruzi]
MREGEKGAKVHGLAMDAQEVGSAAVGIVQPMRRCLVVHTATAVPFSTNVFCNPDMVVDDLRKRMQDGEVSPDGPCVWVDMQGCTDEQNRNVLRLLFPDLQQSQIEWMIRCDTYDAVELQPVKGEYLIGSLACPPNRGPSLSAPAASEVEKENTVVCTFACNDRFLVTMHAAPFVGLAELLRHVEVEGSGGHRDGASAAPNTASPLMQRSIPPAPSMRGITSAAILSLLVCFTCEAFLPDPTSLLAEVGNIDEMVLLISPGEQDQRDLLRRVALLRRRISNFRTGLYLKEKILQELIAPTMRLSFVAKEPDTVRDYKETLGKVRQVSERLDDARDMLNQANLNFVTGVSMRMAQASAGLDFKMSLLNQLAAICLPIHLVISVFGMNCKVPFNRDEYPTLVPFWIICAAFVFWALLCASPLLRMAIQGLRATPVTSYE